MEIGISAGTHKVVLTKFQHEDSLPFIAHIQPGKTQMISGKQLPLVKQGVLAFNIQPATATARYELSQPGPHRQSGTARVSDTAFLTPGVYTVHLEAPGRAGITQTVTVKSGERTEVKMTLAASPGAGPPAPDGPQTKLHFEDASSWSREDSWWTLKTPQYGWLQANRGVFDINIKRQSKGLAGKAARRIEWTLDYRAKGDKVVYWIEDNTLHRMVFMAGKVVFDDPKVPLKMKSGDVYHFVFDISSFRVAVGDGLGNKLDQFDRPHSNIAPGKFGFLGPVALSIQRMR
jgi:hypothetical protein